MRIGVFGGCFNPPHNKHLSIALELIQNNYLDKVIYVPTASCYEKKDIIPFTYRYNMLTLLTKQYSNLKVSDISCNPKYFYTYQVLDEMQKRYPHNKLFFICGEDNLENLDTWKNYQYILQNYQILVIRRGNKNLEKIVKKYAPYQKRIIACNIRAEGTSSTLIREMIQAGNLENLNKFIDKEIYHYIIENNLYKEVS